MSETSTTETTTESTDEFDVIVLGGGPVGENAAQYAIEGTDLTAAIVERELVGGECSYYACVPSKALLRPVDVAEISGDLEGLAAAELRRDDLLARRDTWVHGYDDASQAEWAEGAGIAVVRGHGRLAGERAVEVTGDDGAVRRLRARRAVIIATGSEPVVPSEYAEAEPWGSRDATGVVEVPGSLVIIGGGVVACEAATWMAGLGAQVTMLVHGAGLLSGQEPAAGEAVAEALRGRGVRIELGAQVTACTRDDAAATGLGRIHGGTVHVRAERKSETADGNDADDQDRTIELDADEILVATGRRPRLSDVGLDAVGLAPEDVLDGLGDDGAIGTGTADGGTGEKDAGDPWLFAVGDASGEAPLTHWGKYRARVVGQRIRAAALAALAADGTRDADDARGSAPESPEEVPAVVPVPQVVFTDPQVASVGLTAAAAREAGYDVAVAEVPFASATGAALVRDTPAGTATIVVDRADRTLLGATFVGPECAELVHGATIAIVGRVPVHVLRHAVPVFPAASELWLRLLEELPREMRRTPGA
ncbi:dihydrolipoyl dehydrogenase family protein [Brachybacterium huguangmaarense]